jgi:hypothetical protein
MTWITATLSPEQAANEAFECDDENRIPLDGGHVVTLGRQPDGTPAVRIEMPGVTIIGIADEDRQ